MGQCVSKPCVLFIVLCFCHGVHLHTHIHTYIFWGTGGELHFCIRVPTTVDGPFLEVLIDGSFLTLFNWSPHRRSRRIFHSWILLSSDHGSFKAGSVG